MAPKWDSLSVCGKWVQRCPPHFRLLGFLAGFFLKAIWKCTVSWAEVQFKRHRNRMKSELLSRATGTIFILSLVIQIPSEKVFRHPFSPLQNHLQKGMEHKVYNMLLEHVRPTMPVSKKIATDPWNIPQTLNHLSMKEILPYLYFGVPGVCSRGLLEFS